MSPKARARKESGKAEGSARLGREEITRSHPRKWEAPRGLTDVTHLFYLHGDLCPCRNLSLRASYFRTRLGGAARLADTGEEMGSGRRRAPWRGLRLGRWETRSQPALPQRRPLRKTGAGHPGARDPRQQAARPSPGHTWLLPVQARSQRCPRRGPQWPGHHPERARRRRRPRPAGAAAPRPSQRVDPNQGAVAFGFIPPEPRPQVRHVGPGTHALRPPSCATSADPRGALCEGTTGPRSVAPQSVSVRWAGPRWDTVQAPGGTRGGTGPRWVGQRTDPRRTWGGTGQVTTAA